MMAIDVLMNPAASPGYWGCRCLSPKIRHVIYTKNFAQNFGAAKKHGNNM